MGNCLPFMYIRRSSEDTEQLEERNQRHSTSSSVQSHPQQPSQPSRRSRSHTSSYVNQLYASSNAYMEEGEQQAIDEKRKARVRGILASIPISKYQSGQSINDECAICMLDFEPNESLRYLPCKHGYHVDCIDDWLLRSFTCPSCMEPVDSALLSVFTASSGIVDLASIPNKATSSRS
ncbi:unnamed protein product [Bursaphelenchus xylophilus]|uniref:(pine wood nematode) hypothetical protein n=1 Tax=Bursaphelenchus xylophilus TaxID=6326 RepID=A0A1I7SV92_BURXY|nr:unnamed protein product [Bursaphelenchus xylophilus]CAG9101091.1 unnamed protein product [Bursaphelenchus xylophilus]